MAGKEQQGVTFESLGKDTRNVALVFVGVSALIGSGALIVPGLLLAGAGEVQRSAAAKWKSSKEQTVYQAQH